MPARQKSDRRRRSVRFRISTLLLVMFATLTPLWAFTIYLTVPGAISMARGPDRHPRIGIPTDVVDTQLSQESRATAIYLADRSAGRPGDRGPVEQARAATDKAVDNYRAKVPAAVDEIGQNRTKRITPKMLAALNGLDAERAKIDHGQIGLSAVFDVYQPVIDLGLQTLNSLTMLPDSTSQSNGEALSRLTRSRLLLEQMDARAMAATTAGRLSDTDRQAFVTSLGAADGSYATALPNAMPIATTRYNQIQAGADMSQLKSLEARLAAARPDAPLDVTPQQWTDAFTPVHDALRKMEYDTAVALGQQTLPVAETVFERAGAATLFGLIGVAAVVILSIRIGRGLIREMTLVRDQMEAAATLQLPELVRRLRQGRTVDPDEFGDSRAMARLRTRELDDLNRSFSRVRRVAVDSATGESKLREGVSQVFVNLARRNQALLHRQLKMLDEIERESTDPERLSQLFALDHLATRMRRHAESLIILSGSSPGRGWSHPVAVLDVVRSAVTEVEDYPRVTVHPMPTVQVVGSAVADMIHMLAELIENAAQFSPSDSPVQVRCMSAANGFVIEVEDAGLSMKDEAMAELNAQLADPPEFDLTDTSRLGLFVVGQLAQRHGVKVSLRVSPYGGTTAIVLLPSSLLTDADRTVEPAPPGTPLPRRAGGHNGTPVPELEPRPAAEPAPPPRGNDSTQILPRIGDEWEPIAPVSPAVSATPPEPPATPRHRRMPGQPPVARRADYSVPPPVLPELPSLGTPPLPANPLRDVQPDAGRPSLPRRERQRSLAPQLRDHGTDTAAAPPEPADGPAPEAVRSPEEARSLLSAIQRGWSGIRPDDQPAGSMDVAGDHGADDTGDPPDGTDEGKNNR